MAICKPGDATAYEPEKLVDMLYAEILSSASWSNALNILPRISDHGGWFLSSHDVVNDRPLYRLSTRGLERTEDEYHQHLYSLNTRMKLAMQAPEGYVVRGSDVLSDQTFRRSEYYNDFLRRFDLFHVFGTVLRRDDQQVVAIGTLRSEGEGDFDENERRFLAALAPGLKRLLQVQPRMAELIRQRDSALEISARGQLGVVMLDQLGRMIQCNPVAEEILEARQLAELSQGRLRLHSPAVQARLAAVLQHGEHSPEVFMLSDALGSQRLEVLFLPLDKDPSFALGDASESAAVAVLIRDPDEQPFIQPESLIALFGLTQMESAVAAAFANGFDSHRCCRLLDISQNTLKTHLRQVFAKTGAHSQAELVRMILTSVAADA